MTYDALVVGAGPAGATAALMLAKAGWSVAVVEKASFPRRKVCGEFISATSLPVLQELGVARTFLQLAGPAVRRVGLFAQETVLAAAMPSSGFHDGWGRALGREHLDLILLEAAARAGARLWQPASAVELQKSKDGYACRIAAKGADTELSSRVVILAHGSWEAGRLATQAARAHRPSDLLAFKAHFAECDLPDDLMPLIVFPGGYGGMVHSDSGRVTLSCCIRRDELRHCRRRYRREHAGEAVLQHIQSSCGGVRDALAGARIDGAWLSAGPIRPGIRKRYADGVSRVGNAAGEAHPIVAEGISMAMQSAWLLAHALVASQDDVGRGLGEIATDYRAAWNRHFAARVRAASVFAHVAMRPNNSRLLLPIVERFPKVLTFGAWLSGKTRELVPAL